MDYYVKIDGELYLDTGEIRLEGTPQSWVEVTSNAYNIQPKGAFHIHRSDALYSFIEAMAGKRGKVATFLLKTKDPRNICITRVEDIARGSGVAIQTANEALKLMRGANSIKTITGAVMVNPRLDRIGDKQREGYLMKLYETFDSRTRRTIDKNEEEEA